MRGWGLTEKQRKAEPWGLPQELLRPHKKITDPVHGDIHLTALETAVLDTTPMQRLRRVRQLGTTHLVYPGATHTRFSHALGTQRAAQDLLDVVLNQKLGLHPVDDDLFSEWQDKHSKVEFDRMVGEATVLARLGGLLHDLGHIPFGHTLEDDLGFFAAHDDNLERYECLWDVVERELKERTDLLPNDGIALSEDLTEQLKPLILSKQYQGREESQRYPFVSDLVGNTICADLIDYLERDHRYTGLPAAFGSRFLDGFYVTNSGHRYRPQRMVIRVRKDGRPRADVVSEVFKYLRFRYELSERVLFHHAKLAADVMIGKAMRAWQAALVEELGDKVKAANVIEQQMLRRGDDGLLEYMLDEAEAEERSGNEHWKRIAGIVRQLHRRRLYRQIGVYSKRPMAHELYEHLEEDKNANRMSENVARAEELAADSANVDHSSMVALWVPDPKMRLKPAEVLVDDGSQIEVVELQEWDRANGQRSLEITESHRDLWAVRVYVDRRLDSNQDTLVLDSLKSQLAIEEWDPSPGPVADYQIDAFVRDLSLYKGWVEDGGLSIRHPQLLNEIADAHDSVVEVRGRRISLESEDGLRRVNLLLFLRDMDKEKSMSSDERDAVAAAILESQPLFEKHFSEAYTATGPDREVQSDAEEAARQAFYAAAEKVVPRKLPLP